MPQRSGACVALALGAGLVVADVSIVTLALPQLLDQLQTSIEGVASVLGLYTLLLGLCLPLCARLRERVGSGSLGAVGFTAFAAGAVVCAAAGSLGLLLTGRAVQAVGGSAALVAAFDLLDARGAGRRTWLGAAVLSSAAGPALGGTLTEVFDWRAIFVVQAPFAAIAALLAWRRRLEPQAPAPPFGEVRRPAVSGSPPRWLSSVALILLSGALSAVLFLLVLLLVAGWNVSPWHAALAVSALPLAAALGTRVRAEPQVLASSGCLLVATGTLALAWVPEAELGWTLLPQALAGVGMGLALPALAGGLLSQRTPREAARLLSLRHLGIALALLALAPVITDRLEGETHLAKLRGVALVLDAPIEPQRKLELAPALLGSIDQARPLATLDAALRQQRGSYPGDERAPYEHLSSAADATLLAAISAAFRDAFLIAGALALLAGALMLPRRRFSPAVVTGALALAIVAPAVYLVERDRLAPAPVPIADPCVGRALPSATGLQGVVQAGVLKVLDRDACRLHTNREELVLASGNAAEGRRFAREHDGVAPGSLQSILEALL